MRPLAVLVAMLVSASAAHADSPKLADARKAIDEVRFDDAQRLLVGALADGDNSPAGVREIYKLSASTAVVLGQREIGEQYYRRWLALDASAAVGPDIAPKLRAPFEAAQTYIAAHGRLSATTTRLSRYELDVAVVDPLAMAASATIVGSTPVALSTERRARLTPTDAGSVVIAILDDRGNRLLELSAGPAAEDAIVGKVDPADDPYAPDLTKPLPPQAEPTEPRRWRVWFLFAVTSAALLGTGVGFGMLATNTTETLEEEIAASRTHYYEDIAEREKRINAYIAIGGSLFGAGVILAIPAVYLFWRSRKDDEPAVVPVVSGGSAGAAVVGRF